MSVRKSLKNYLIFIQKLKKVVAFSLNTNIEAEPLGNWKTPNRGDTRILK